MKKLLSLVTLSFISSLVNATVVVNVPGVGGVGFSETITLTTPYDPTQSLYNQIDNAGVNDGNAIVVSQSAVAPSTDTVTHIQWNGAGNPGLGFIIEIWDESVASSTPPSLLGFPGHVTGKSLGIYSLPTGQFTTTTSASGLTHYDAIIPPLAITAGHGYYLTIAPVSGNWAWEAAASCTTATSCGLLGKYSGATYVVMGALQILGSPPVAFQLTNDVSATKAPAVPPVINTTTLPAATVGANYSASISSTVPTGDSATVVVTGLPAGLSFNAATNTITGAASSIGNFSVNVTVTDTSTQLSASSQLALTINDIAVVFTPANLPNAVTNATYSTTFVPATGGYGAISYAASALPSGLILTGNTISGTPNTAGAYTITLSATDSVGFISTAAVSLNVVNPVIAPVVCSGNNGVITAYTAGTPGSITVNGGLSLLNQLWTTNLNASNTTFNGGLLNWNATGTIVSWSGTVDPTGCILTQLTVSPRVVISTTTLASAVAGTAYSAPITVTGGVAPYTTSLSGLPAGLSFNGSAITGTPTVAGTFIVTANTIDAVGVSSASSPLTLNVAAPAISAFSATLSAGTVGTSYTGSVAASGGYGTLSYSVTGLPTGLSLSGKSITGTPTTAGVYTVGFTVTDKLGTSASISSSVNIANAAVTSGPSCTKPTGATGGLNSMGNITAINGSAVTFATSKGVSVTVTVPVCAKITWNGGAKTFAIGQAFEWNGYSSTATGNVAQSVTIN